MSIGVRSHPPRMAELLKGRWSSVAISLLMGVQSGVGPTVSVSSARTLVRSLAAASA